jgi:hypothetical protein
LSCSASAACIRSLGQRGFGMDAMTPDSRVAQGGRQACARGLIRDDWF